MLSSCAYFSQYDNVEHSRYLRVGMTKQQVLKIMGEPLRDERYNRPDVWYYYVDTQWHDFITTEDECMPVVFEKGKVVGWGNEYFNKCGMKHKYAD
jgi:outer membrane protein assembly factor BamE (lipoprotein component of BamABCDE complex)